jgi:hypothetical protein
VCKETADWKELTRNFKVNFSFEDDAPLIKSSLYVIKNDIFSLEDSIRLVLVCSTHRYYATIEKVLHCYNVIEEDKEEDEDPRNVQIPKTKGEHEIEGPKLESVVYEKPLRTRKVNICIEYKPKFVNI